jgi:Tfp pilus assembly protein PilF
VSPIAARAAVAAALLCAAGCSRSAKPEPQRLAILRFENLSADSTADWMGRALAEILTAELSASPGISSILAAQFHAFDRTFGARPISLPGISAERADAMAAGANRVGYGEYLVRGGRLSARLSIEDARAGKMTQVILAATAADNVLGAATDLARQISSQITPYGTRNLECIQLYAQAMEAGNFSASSAALNRAIAADPNFGPAYRLLAEIDAQHGDRAGALEVVNQAAARGNAIAPIESARIAVVAAELHGDSAARQAGLKALVKLEPGNAATWQTLAQLALSRHDYKQSADSYRHAIELQPENATLLNDLGYAAAYGGDFDAGLAALRRYQQMRPSDANALDSLGDINLLAGRLREAETFYLQANQKNPEVLPTGAGSDLFKATMARAMTGDIAGADDLHKKFIESRTTAKDPNTPFRELEWLWLTGRRKQAYTQMQALAGNFEHGSQQPAAAHAYAELALWSLMSGNRAAAAEMAQKAVTLATQATAAPPFISRFLAQPSASAEEWKARTERFIPNAAQSAGRDQMLAYALLLDGKASAADAPLQRIYDISGIAAGEGLPVLLAWTRLANGDAATAAQLLRLYPVPPGSGVSTFMPLYFPKIFELRSEVAAKAGKTDEAKQDMDLFRRLSGN